MSRNKNPYGLTRLRLGLCLFVLVACPADPAFADGKFFRKFDIADEPGIQAQRAVVAYRDGVETLIVQSDVTGKGESFGWLLPLPAEPTSIEPCHPHTLMALGDVIRPDITKHPRTLLAFSLLLMLLMFFACVDYLRSRARGNSPSVLVRAVSVIAALLFLLSILLPGLNSARLLRDQVTVTQSLRAGVYDVRVITASTPEAVQQWLTSNGFASPPSATAVIQDYVSRRWCFLAARVSTDLKQAVTHHPLRVTFPASNCVYPMKLTGSDGEPVQLDLWVIGERRAAAKYMKTWTSDSYDVDVQYAHRFDDYESTMPAVYKARTRGLARVGIPAVSGIMWDGCVVTRLHGRLEAADMNSDLDVTWHDASPERLALYSRAGALGDSASMSLLVLAVAFASFTSAAARLGWSWQTMLRRRIVVMLVLSLLAGGARYAMLQVVPVKSHDTKAGRSMLATSIHLSALRELEKHPPEMPFPDVYRQIIEKKRPDVDWHGVAELKARGDFAIEATDDGWRLTIVAWPYVPVSIPIDADGTPIRASE